MKADGGDLPQVVSIHRRSQHCPLSLRDKMMKTRNIENKLAVLAALIVLIGVALAAGSAFGAETADAAGTYRTEMNSAVETIIGAREANTDAAADAAKALKAENALDLDIRFAVLSSRLVAGAK